MSAHPGLIKRNGNYLIQVIITKGGINILPLIVFLFFLSPAHAQSHLQWVTDEISPNQLSNNVIAMGTDGNGTTYSVNKEQNNTFPAWTVYRFIAYDTNANKLWQVNNDTCFTNCQEQYTNIIPINNNGAIFIGTYGDSTGIVALRFKRLDSNGNLLWYNQISYPQLQPSAPIIAKLDNNGDIVIGMSFYTLTDLENFVFAKYDTIAGNEVWHFELPDQGPVGIALQEICAGLEIDNNNNLYFIGNGDRGPATIFRRYYFSVSPGGIMNYFGFTDTNPLIGLTHDMCKDAAGSFYRLLSFNSSMVVFKQDTVGGFFQWTVPLQHDSALTRFIQLEADSFSVYVLGNYNYFFPDTTFSGGQWSNNHYYLTKIDTAGNIVWQKDYFNAYNSYSANSNVGGADHMVMCNNNIYITSTSLVDSTDLKIILHKIDSAGNTVWFDSTSTGPSLPLQYDANCNIYFSGGAADSSSLWYPFMRTQKFSDTPLSFNNETGLVNDLLIYPNPAKDHFTIKLNNEGSLQQQIDVYNSQGQRVIADLHTLGNAVIPVNTWTDGLYLIQIKINGQVMQNKKLLILH